jgi:hypothetical protein
MFKRLPDVSGYEREWLNLSASISGYTIEMHCFPSPSERGWGEGDIEPGRTVAAVKIAVP